jgi:hypothetical protein
MRRGMHRAWGAAGPLPCCPPMERAAPPAWVAPTPCQRPTLLHAHPAPPHGLGAHLPTRVRAPASSPTERAIAPSPLPRRGARDAPGVRGGSGAGGPSPRGLSRSCVRKRLKRTIAGPRPRVGAPRGPSCAQMDRDHAAPPAFPLPGAFADQIIFYLTYWAHPAHPTRPGPPHARRRGAVHIRRGGKAARRGSGVHPPACRPVDTVLILPPPRRAQERPAAAMVESASGSSALERCRSLPSLGGFELSEGTLSLRCESGPGRGARGAAAAPGLADRRRGRRQAGPLARGRAGAARQGGGGHGTRAAAARGHGRRSPAPARVSGCAPPHAGRLPTSGRLLPRPAPPGMSRPCCSRRSSSICATCGACSRCGAATATWAPRRRRGTAFVRVRSGCVFGALPNTGPAPRAAPPACPPADAPPGRDDGGHAPGVAREAGARGAAPPGARGGDEGGVRLRGFGRRAAAAGS